MNKSLLSKFDMILTEGLKRYGASLKCSKRMLSKQNIIYSFYKDGNEYIILVMF